MSRKRERGDEEDSDDIPSHNEDINSQSNSDLIKRQKWKTSVPTRLTLSYNSIETRRVQATNPNFMFQSGFIAPTITSHSYNMNLPFPNTNNILPPGKNPGMSMDSMSVRNFYNRGDKGEDHDPPAVVHNVATGRVEEFKISGWAETKGVKVEHVDSIPMEGDALQILARMHKMITFMDGDATLNKEVENQAYSFVLLNYLLKKTQLHEIDIMTYLNRFRLYGVHQTQDTSGNDQQEMHMTPSQVITYHKYGHMVMSNLWAAYQDSFRIGAHLFLRLIRKKQQRVFSRNVVREGFIYSFQPYASMHRQPITFHERMGKTDESLDYKDIVKVYHIGTVYSVDSTDALSPDRLDWAFTPQDPLTFQDANKIINYLGNLPRIYVSLSTM
jgi:hypothetical protein